MAVPPSKQLPKLTPTISCLFSSWLRCSSSAASVEKWFASARDRLPESRQFIECGVMFGAVRARSVHKACYGHNRDWAAAQPLLARGAEAGDRCGVVCAGLVGVGRCPAIRRERESSVQLAEALSRRSASGGGPAGSSTDPGDDYSGTGCSRGAATGCGGTDRD